MGDGSLAPPKFGFSDKPQLIIYCAGGYPTDPGDPYIVWENGDVWFNTNTSGNNLPSYEPDYLTYEFDQQYHRTVQTVLRYYTGGKAIPGVKNLFEFDVSAAHMNNPFAEPGWDGVGLYNESTTPVPGDNIYIGSLGQASGDPVLYAALPNNVVVDLSVRVIGDNHDIVSMYGTKHTLSLTANGTNLNAVTPTFCVGQQVNFAPSFSPPLANVASQLGLWKLTGNYVNHYTQANSQSSTNYDISKNVLGQPNTSAWWLTNGNQLSATLNMDITFNNGQHAAPRQTGFFNIYRPSLANFTAYPPFSLLPVNLGDGTRMMRLGYGPSGSISNSGDMFFGVQIASQYSGDADFTQLISGYFTNAGGLTGPINGFALDTDVFYTGTNGPAFPIAAFASTNTINLWDSPSVQEIGPTVAMSLSFSDYARFRPAGPSNIFVTLGIVNWSVNALTTGTTNGSGGIIYSWPTGGVPTNEPVLIDSAALPAWTNVSTGSTGFN